MISFIIISLLPLLMSVEILFMMNFLSPENFLFFCLSRYDAEATYFDEGVRSAKRRQFEEKLLQVIHLCV